MEPPKGVFGNVLAGSLALGGAAWAGAALNSRSVSRQAPAAATAAAALGGVTGALLALFGAAALGVSESKWKVLGQTTTILGIGSFAALALVGLRVNDQLLAAAGAGGTPQALVAGEADSGSTFNLRVGDTLTVELPAGQDGFKWSWSTGPAGLLEGPVVATSQGGLEHDTWTATKAGAGKVTAQLTPDAGGAATATWTADVTVTS
jgi:hypothetical protein